MAAAKKPARGKVRSATARKAATPEKASARASAPARKPPVPSRAEGALPDLFLETVRAHDLPAKTVGEAWRKATKLALLTFGLVGASPTPKRTAALLDLFRKVAAELTAEDRATATSALAAFEAAAASDETRVKNRAAFELAERRDRAVVARRPALAAFVDALSHAAEAVASHADGDAESPPRRGREVGRALLFAVAEQRTGDGESEEARRAASLELAAHLRRLLPGGPWA